MDWKDCIVIKAPAPVEPQGERESVIAPAFNLLSSTMRAAAIGSVAWDAKNFSLDVDVKAPGAHIPNSFFIKAPGTDFYLPSVLDQFEGAVRGIIDNHYDPRNDRPINRDGNEYCRMTLVQTVFEPEEKFPPGPVHHHVDQLIPAVVSNSWIFLTDRYIVSDIAEISTAFYDYDFNLEQESPDYKNADAWFAKLIADKAGPPRQFEPYDIVHFSSATPHARVSPVDPVFRTVITVTFTAEDQDLNDFGNPALAAAYEKSLNVLMANPKVPHLQNDI
jgi:hypothetical protein